MIGITSLFVDLLWAGNSELLQILQKLKIIFQVCSEKHKLFTYVEITLKQNYDFSITVEQHIYTESMQPIPVTREQINNPQQKCH